MANYYCAARTSYFKVKDVEKFKKFVSEFPNNNIDVWETNDEDHGKLFAIGQKNQSESISSVWCDDKDDYRYFFQEMAEHIADDWACIYLETGAEKLRYLIGVACIYTNKGLQEDEEINAFSKAYCEKNNLKFTAPEY